MFLIICGIAVAVCGAYGVFNRNSDHAQNLTPRGQSLSTSKATKVQNSMKILNETEENVHNSNENSKEMELLSLTIAPCFNDDTKFKHSGDLKEYQHNSEHKNLNVFQRNKKTSIFFGISVLFNMITTIAYSMRNPTMVIPLTLIFLTVPPFYCFLSVFMQNALGEWLVSLLVPIMAFAHLTDEFWMESLFKETHDITILIIIGMGILTSFSVIGAFLFKWVSYFRSPRHDRYQLRFLLVVPIVTILFFYLASRSIISHIQEHLLTNCSFHKILLWHLESLANAFSGKPIRTLELVEMG